MRVILIVQKLIDGPAKQVKIATWITPFLKPKVYFMVRLLCVFCLIAPFLIT